MHGKEWRAVTENKLIVPPTFNFAIDVLAQRAELHPSHTAVVSVGMDRREERWSYARVLEATQRFAGALAEAGIRSGDRVLVFMPRTALWLVAMAACHYLGAVPVPCVTQVSASEVAYRLRRSGARAAVTVSELADRYAGLLDMIDVRFCRGQAEGWRNLDDALKQDHDVPAPALMPADAPALMYFTSGSSGLPRAVVHAARGVFVRSWQPWHLFDTSEKDVIWTTSDTGWTRAGSCLLYGAWFWGATALIVEPGLSPQEKVDMLARHGVTIYSAVATELRQILSSATPVPLPRLRFTLSAGEAMTEELSHAWTRFSGAPLLVAYGQTETPQCTITTRETTPENGMIGLPMPGNVVTVLDDHNHPCPAGEPGELAVRADNPGLMLGYWNDGEIEPGFSGGWHRTGDAAYMDKAGNIFFVGRSDDIISSSGYRIGPTEVENALMIHPAVKECAVTAVPDPLRGEAVKAYVVLEPGYLPSDELVNALQAHVKGSIAPYKYPRRIDFLEELPRTPSGKVSRRLLRESTGARRTG